MRALTSVSISNCRLPFRAERLTLSRGILRELAAACGLGLGGDCRPVDEKLAPQVVLKAL